MSARGGRRWLVVLAALGPACLAAGCSQPIDRSYGRSRSASVNGTAVFAALLRERGHKTRSALRLTEELGEWAEVVVRFAPWPGAPERAEGAWYARWLDGGEDRRVVYVTRDYDGLADYWSVALAQLAPDAPPRLRERVEEAGRGAGALPLPRPAKEAARPEDWFAVEAGKPAAVCKALGRPWAAGVDATAAALTRRETFKVDGETVLLSGDGAALVMARERPNGGRALAVANGSFLLNAGLANHARRPLADRVADWLAADPDGGGSGAPRNVAFVEGAYVTAGPAAGPSVFHLLTVPPFGWIAAQALALALAACLARAPRLGRAKAEPPSGAERPVAHPEALGALLARAGQAREARSLLETYKRWRAAPGARPPGPT